MQLTIIPNDNVVLIDGQPIMFDLSGYTSLNGLHAVQWDDALGYGHTEFDNRLATQATFKVNEKITSIAPYQDIIDAWYAKEAIVEPSLPPPP